MRLASKKLGPQKLLETKIHAMIIFHPFAETLLLERLLWILVCGVISPT